MEETEEKEEIGTDRRRGLLSYLKYKRPQKTTRYQHQKPKSQCYLLLANLDLSSQISNDHQVSSETRRMRLSGKLIMVKTVALALKGSHIPGLLSVEQEGPNQHLVRL